MKTILACRAMRIEDWSPARQRVWAEVAAAIDDTPAIYPGSTTMQCEGCLVDIAVGPRMQEKIPVLLAAGHKVLMLCLFCAVEYGSENGAVEVCDLGNDFRKKRDKSR